jgi:hypothetical protein
LADALEKRIGAAARQDTPSTASSPSVAVKEDSVIHFELLRDRNILVITPDGPLEKPDFERLASEIDPIIASKGKLASVMVCAQSFPGWQSFDAFVARRPSRSPPAR